MLLDNVNIANTFVGIEEFYNPTSQVSPAVSLDNVDIANTFVGVDKSYNPNLQVYKTNAAYEFQ